MAKDSERPKFPKAVRSGEAVTVYDKQAWLDHPTTPDLIEATESIGHWFDPSYNFKLEKVLDQTQHRQPSFGATFSSPYPPIGFHINGPFKFLSWELNIKKVIPDSFALGYNVKFVHPAQGYYDHIEVPSTAIGYYGQASMKAREEVEDELASFYVTGAKISPFLIFNSGDRNRVIGQDLYRLQVDVNLQTPTQFLERYQADRRVLWRDKEAELESIVRNNKDQLKRSQERLAEYSPDRLAQIEQVEKELLSKAGVPDRVYA